MTCVHCGEATLTRSYTLRFTPETHHPKVIDLQLCTVCLRRLRAESDIELLADPVATAD